MNATRINVILLFSAFVGLVPQASNAESTAPSAPLPVPKSETWRKARPKPSAPKEPTLPGFESTSLSNGLTLLVAEPGPLPLVSFVLVIKGGATLDPPGKEGLTALTYAMLQEGAGALDALAFADKVADLGAGFGASGDRDSGSVAITGLSKNADAMLELMASTISSPKHDPADFERVKAQALASIERRRSSPQGLVFDELAAIVYGDKHPLGHSPTGSRASIATLTLADVKAQHARVFGPKNAALIVTGQMSLAEAAALATRQLGTWKTEVPALIEVPALEAEKREKVVLIDKGPSPQTVFAFARPLFGKGGKDEAALSVANVVFGGAFTSRLNLNLREKKGYTYGASSQAIFRHNVGVFVASSAIRSDVIGPALVETIKELDGMSKKPPSKDEVDRAKSNMIRSLSGDFETTSSMAGAAAQIFANDLPLDYFKTLPATYQAVTVDAVRKASAQYMERSKLKLLLVGDAATVGPALEPLKLGTLEVRKP